MGQLTSVYALTEDEADWVRRRQQEALHALHYDIELRKDPAGGPFELATVVHKTRGRMEIPTTCLDKAWPDMKCVLDESGPKAREALGGAIPLDKDGVDSWVEAVVLPVESTVLLRSALAGMSEKSAREACAKVDWWASAPDDPDDNVDYVVEYLMKLRDFLRAKCPVGGNRPLRCVLFSTC